MIPIGSVLLWSVFFIVLGVLAGFAFGIKLVVDILQNPPEIGQPIQIAVLGFKYPKKPFLFMSEGQPTVGKPTYNPVYPPKRNRGRPNKTIRDLSEQLGISVDEVLPMLTQAKEAQEIGGGAFKEFCKKKAVAESTMRDWITKFI